MFKTIGMLILTTILSMGVSSQTLEQFETDNPLNPASAMQLTITCPPSPVQVGVPVPITICYLNNGGKAKNVTLYLSTGNNSFFVSATSINFKPGFWDPSVPCVNWYLEDIDHGQSSCGTATIFYSSTGTEEINGQIVYQVGSNTLSVSVTCSVVTTTDIAINLLRYNGVTSINPLTPPASTIFPLTMTRDLEQPNFTTGSYWPNESNDLLSTAPPLVFYQIPNDLDTLRITKDSTKITITF